MHETPSRKVFFVELLLFVALFGAAASLLFPWIWEPVLGLVVDMEEPEPNQSLLTRLPDPAPEKNIVRVQTHKNIGEFRTSLGRQYDVDLSDNQFEPRKNVQPKDWLSEGNMLSDSSNSTEPANSFSPITAGDAPPLPVDDWDIQPMSSPNQDAQQGMPELRPQQLTDDVIGKVEPILTNPDGSKRSFVPDNEPGYIDEDEFSTIEFGSLPNKGTGSKDKNIDPPFLPTDPTWWIGEIQQPQLGDRQSLPISLDTVVLMALQRAPEVQVLNTEPEVQRTLIDQNIAAFDWSTFVNTAWNDTNVPVGDELQTGIASGRFVESQLSVEGGVTKLLANGGDIRVGQTFTRRDNNSQFFIPNDQGISSLVIDYRQPLLRGAGKRFAQTQIVQARLDFDQIQSQSIQGIQEYLVEVVTAYWELYEARARVIQTRRSFERATDLLVRLKNRDGIDVTNDQIFRAEAAAGARKSDAIAAEYEVKNAQDVLVNLTVGPDSRDANRLELIPEPMVLPEHYGHDIETLAFVALRNRPEISEAIARIKTGETLQFIAENELLPQLDAILSTSVTGLRGDFDTFGAFGDQFSEGDPSYSIGFEFELPIGNRVAKSVVQRQQLQSRIFTQQFEKSVGDVVLDVRVAARNLERFNSEMQNNFKALHKAAQELEYIRTRQELLLDEGKTGSFYIEDLLASQARLTQAEARLLESQTGHAIALVDLKRATGELLNARVHADQYLPMEVEHVSHVQILPEATPTPIASEIPTVIEPLPAVPPTTATESQGIQWGQVDTTPKSGDVHLLPEITPISPEAGSQFIKPVYAPN